MSDPYLDPDTGILRNKLGLKEPAALDLAERRAASIGLDRIDAGYRPERTFGSVWIQPLKSLIVLPASF